MKLLKMLLLCTALVVAASGCSNDLKTSATAGSAGPQLSSTDPAERAEAAKEAGKKYGANP